MVLSSQNCGKYLMNRWHEQRAQAISRPEMFTQAELDWLEVTEADVRREHDPLNRKVQTQPIDPLTEPKTVDMEE
jgi:hypothetical protein